MRELWTSPTPAFAGKYTEFSGLKFEPKPVQRPHPPIWVGGHGRASLRRAAEIGAAWHPINRSAEELRAGREALAARCRARGRAVPPPIALRNDVCVLRPGGRPGASVRGGSVLAGEPAALVDRLAELRDVGVEHLVLEFLAPDGAELDAQMAVFAERVRPALT
jgi:alkanesulfonate monooxygenase SsuD/methylene tetrahydromethanopterin reductase-like flavin-dependent oxidoreductase (luciferase family)